MRAIGLLEEDLVLEAQRPERLRVIRRRRWVALAACAALLMALPWLRMAPWLSGGAGSAQDSLQAEAGEIGKMPPSRRWTPSLPMLRRADLGLKGFSLMMRRSLAARALGRRAKRLPKPFRSTATRTTF